MSPEWGRVSQAEIDAAVAVETAARVAAVTAEATARDAAVAVHAALLAAHTKNLYEVLAIGSYQLCHPIHSLQAGAIAANQLLVQPFLAARNITVDRIAVQITIAGGAGTLVRLGIYRDNGAGYPGVLLLDAGSVPADGATGNKTITISQALTKGLYWTALISDGTPTIRLGLFSAGQLADDNASNPTSGLWKSQAYGALSDPAPSGLGTAANFWLIPLRIASLD